MRLIGDGGKNIEIRAAHLVQLQPRHLEHIVVSYDGSRHQSGLNVYLNGRAVPTQGGGNQNVEFAGDIGVDNPLVLGKALAQGAIADFRMFNRAVSESEALLLFEWPTIAAALPKTAADLNDTDQSALRTWYLFREGS